MTLILVRSFTKLLAAWNW
jgi:hypothetical protein